MFTDLCDKDRYHLFVVKNYPNSIFFKEKNSRSAMADSYLPNQGVTSYMVSWEYCINDQIGLLGLNN